ncbi:MAG: SH3 domain-containing protein [Syntrophobacterales bacterium]|nr:SH3 domain-containing protein [Syntrophobacterales bacterium]
MKTFFIAALTFFYLASVPAGCTSTAVTIRDIHILPQNHTYYLAPQTISVPESVQESQERSYMTRYFFPWHPDREPPEQDIFMRQFLRFTENPGYGENKKKRSPAWIKELRQNAAMENYPNTDATAISLITANLRILPTDKPVYSTPEGYPFDRLQTSSIAPNTPLRVLHASADNGWFLVQAPYAHGWIAGRDIAFVDHSFIQTWKSGKHAVIIQDKILLHDQHGNFLFQAPIGSVFPIVKETDASFQVLAAIANNDKQGMTVPILLSRKDAAARPLPLTGENVARIANELTNEPYGWGGLYQNRDCSGMLKDFFAPFGIWLPRHSADQAREVGNFIDLSSLSRLEKEKKISEEGIPYLTLLWMRGHIMLYMGVHDGHPLVFHNVWGTVAKKRWSKAQRVIVGHAAITTMYPQLTGNSFSPFHGDLIDKIIGMTLVLPQNTEVPDCGCGPGDEDI